MTYLEVIANKTVANTHSAVNHWRPHHIASFPGPPAKPGNEAMHHTAPCTMVN